MSFGAQELTAYLGRIGVPRPAVVDAAALRALHRAHLETVPFENLSIHLGEPISLAVGDLIAKIVKRRRGGFCYELNGAFALLLEALGARVERVAARVHDGSRFGPPFDHLALIVHLADGEPWLADVGFGAHSTYPLRLCSRQQQEDPGGRFRLADGPDGDLDVWKDGAPQYRAELRDRVLADFVPACWWQQTSPESHFVRGPICSRLMPDGSRVSLSGRTLLRTTAGSRHEQELPSADAVLAAYRDHFGILLDREPAAPQ